MCQTSRFQDKINFFSKLKDEDEKKEGFIRSLYAHPFSAGGKTDHSQRSELKSRKSEVILGRRRKLN